MATAETIKRRAYHYAYYRRNKLALDGDRMRWHDNHRHPCPGVGDQACGRSVSPNAKRCRSCSSRAASRRKNDRIRAERQAVKAVPLCPVCRAKMHSRMWHETAFLHCGACGWETTPLEMRRINSENGLKASVHELRLFTSGEVGSVAA